MAGCLIVPADLHRGCVAPRADPSAETQPSCHLEEIDMALGAQLKAAFPLLLECGRRNFKCQDSSSLCLAAKDL